MVYKHRFARKRQRLGTELYNANDRSGDPKREHSAGVVSMFEPALDIARRA